MVRLAPAAAALTLALVAAPACSSGDDALVIYSGRSKALVEPLVDEFESTTGTAVKVRYGGTAQLAIALMQEGENSPADLFWGQDAGALGALDEAGMLAPLDGELAPADPGALHSERGTWVATSGRARVLAYSAARVEFDELPSSIFDLTDERWRGRIGWAPANGSFQSFVTAMIATYGRDAARDWLTGLRDNGAVSYPNNSSLLQAVAAGDVDAVITNHYYLHRLLDDDPDFPVAQTSFEDGDIGNLVNVAGLGILASSNRQTEAAALVSAMLAPEAQRFFADETFELPVIELEDAGRGAGSVTRAEIMAASPSVDLDALADLDASLDLLRDVELL